VLKLSHIICSRNRATQLKITLSKFDIKSLARHNVELVLVDSASEDTTLAIMEAYALSTPAATCVLHADRVGLSVARNVGARASSGDLLIFTDDDCYLGEHYYDALVRDFDPAQHQYGTGQILLFDPSDDGQIATNPFTEKYDLKPYTLLRAGVIQGANMFFSRPIFESVGYFREDLGAGTLFKSAEDTEFATRASFAGFSGVMLPDVIVYHHHRRKLGSAESHATLRGYDIGRGAYYAIRLIQGADDIWELWAQLSQSQGPMSDALATRLEREFRGAADYLQHHLGKK